MANAVVIKTADSRASVRDEVHYRARAVGPDAKPVALLIVNISAGGLMARTDLPYAVGDRLHVTLPIVGDVLADIRWALGGRIGCELDQSIPLVNYHEVLAALLKAR
jgi:hypothetical protein